MDKKVAVIRFPGSNCEIETKYALEKTGLVADIIMWNEDINKLREYSAFVLPGGFSYQDRIRAGCIAAKERIIECIIDESKKGKPVLGICNGAQILVETGLVPGFNENRIDLALAPNLVDDYSGYYCNWIFLKLEVPPDRTPFTYSMDESFIFPVPVAHAEGRFISRDNDVLDMIVKNRQIVFSYVNYKGEKISSFPVNPNGSFNNSAGICNKEGNILALMPHPERALYFYQIPFNLQGYWGEKRRKLNNSSEFGSGYLIFKSLKNFLDKK